MYCWTLLSRNISETPFLLGVTDDLARAQRLAEPHLISGRAFLSYIEAVRSAMSVHSLDTCYVRTGRVWIGRRTISGRVSWQEREASTGHEPLSARPWQYRGRAFASPWACPSDTPANRRSTTTSEPPCASRTPDRRST